MANPISVHVDTYGTVSEGYTDSMLTEIANKGFDLRPGCIIRDLKLKRPIYRALSGYGHFGRMHENFLWEHPKDLKEFMIKEE